MHVNDLAGFYAGPAAKRKVYEYFSVPFKDFCLRCVTHQVLIIQMMVPVPFTS